MRTIPCDTMKSMESCSRKKHRDRAISSSESVQNNEAFISPPHVRLNAQTCTVSSGTFNSWLVRQAGNSCGYAKASEFVPTLNIVFIAMLMTLFAQFSEYLRQNLNVRRHEKLAGVFCSN